MRVTELEICLEKTARTRVYDLEDLIGTKLLGNIVANGLQSPRKQLNSAVSWTLNSQRPCQEAHLPLGHSLPCGIHRCRGSTGRLL